MTSHANGDPDNRYPTDGPRKVDELAARVLRFLPGARIDRTRDVIQLDWHGEEGIVVVVTPEALEFRLPTIEWTKGSYGPAESSRFWKRVEDKRLSESELGNLDQSAKAARRAQYRTCRFCGERYPPERRSEVDVCHGCAEKHLGIVF